MKKKRNGISIYDVSNPEFKKLCSVDRAGFEPAASTMPRWRSSGLIYRPLLGGYKFSILIFTPSLTPLSPSLVSSSGARTLLFSNSITVRTIIKGFLNSKNLYILIILYASERILGIQYNPPWYSSHYGWELGYNYLIWEVS